MKYAITAATGHFGQTAGKILNKLVGKEKLPASFQDPIDDGSLTENSTDLQNALGHKPLSTPAAIKEILARYIH